MIQTNLSAAMIAILSLLAFTCSPTAANAQSENHAPACDTKVIDLSALPPYTNIENLTIDAVKAAPACTDEDGDALALTDVSANAVVSGSANTIRLNQTIQAGESVTVDFTVADGNGATSTSSITVKR
jgi:hypothetical protein